MTRVESATTGPGDHNACILTRRPVQQRNTTWPGAQACASGPESGAAVRVDVLSWAFLIAMASAYFGYPADRADDPDIEHSTCPVP